MSNESFCLRSRNYEKSKLSKCMLDSRIDVSQNNLCSHLVQTVNNILSTDLNSLTSTFIFSMEKESHNKESFSVGSVGNDKDFTKVNTPYSSKFLPPCTQEMNLESDINSTEKSYIHVEIFFHDKYPLSANLNPFAKSFISTMDTNKNIIDALSSVMETSPVANYLSTPILSELSHSEDICSQLNNLSDDLCTVSFNNPGIKNVLTNESSDTYFENQSIDNPFSILHHLKEKNADRPVIAQLNINSVAPKFEPLQSLIKENVDILMVSETKIDDTFPTEQFKIEGYSKPFRMDRNRHGGGVMIFSRDDLPCHELKSHVLPSDVECIFLEMRIRQSKWLIVGGYNPHKNKISYFLDHVGRELDKYLSKYENLLLLGDWNCEMNEEEMKTFCETYNLENLIKGPTCYKNADNPSSIDIMLTNKKLSFQNSLTVETGLSDFHKMTITVLKRFFKKKDPVTITYHDLKYFNGIRFREDIRNQLEQIRALDIDSFKNVFITTWNSHAPVKKLVVRGNNAPFMNRTLSKAFMHRSKLKNRYHKFPTEANKTSYKQMRNVCVNLLKKEKKKYYNNLDLTIFGGNKKFWQHVKPLFSGKSKSKTDICIVENETVITEKGKVAEIMNNYFIEAVQNLKTEKFACETEQDTQDENIDEAIESILKTYRSHPSILKIREHIQVKNKFIFSDTTADEIYSKIKSLDPKKACMEHDIPGKNINWDK